MSFFSIAILIPLFTVFRKPNVFAPTEANWNFSRLDKLTLAVALDDNQTMVIAVLMTYTYSLFAYYLLFTFCTQMSEYEFDTSEQYIDRFVAKHSVIIRGVNTQIGTEEAAKKVTKLFEQRFGKEQKDPVVSCNTFRKSNQFQKLYRKVKTYRKKLAALNEQSELSGEKELVWVGSRLKCNRRQVDGKEFYEEKLGQALEEWESAKESYKNENQGVVIVVFKNRDNVETTINELDVVKSRLAGRQHFDRIGIQDW